MFVALSVDRGFLTVTIAHITFSMCYVAVVVQSRLVSFDPSRSKNCRWTWGASVKTFLYHLAGDSTGDYLGLVVVVYPVAG